MEVKEKVGEDEEAIKKHFIKLVSSLHSDSNNVIYKNLAQLRVDAMKHSSSSKHLCDIGAFKVLIKFLKLPNEKILSVTLSILANCCLTEDSRIKVVECQALPLLASVLRHIAQEGIQNRACRLVANLAQSRKVAFELHKQKAVELIVAVLNTSATSGAHQSAIRALRVLWEMSPAHASNMLACGAVKAAADKLKSEDGEVVAAALKAVSAFTENGHAACASHLDAAAYAALVSRLPDPTASQIVYHLSRGPGALALNNAYAVRAIVGVLASAPRKETHSVLVHALCLLCNECTGRMQLLKADNGLAVFLALLGDSQSQSVRMKLYTVLLHFTPEPQTLLCLTKAGLVPILVNKLDAFLAHNGKPHQIVEKWTDVVEESRDRFEPWHCRGSYAAGASPPYDKSHKASGLSPDLSLGSISPCSDDPCSLSPSFSDSPLVAYSPVCSTTGTNSDEERESVMDGCEENEMETSSTRLGEDSGLESMREDVTIVYILDKLSHIDGTVEDLASAKTVQTLIKYKAQVRNAGLRVINLFQTLVSKQQYYCELLDNNFALEIHRALCRPVHNKCDRCERLRLIGDLILVKTTILSEAGLGEGQMAHRLLTGTDRVKFQVAITVPIVSRDPKLLLRLLFKYKAFEVLIGPLENNNANWTDLEDIAFGLKLLFKTLRYDNPQRKTPKCNGCDIGKLRKESSVLFSLDDGSIVSANKTTLCNNSPVFEAMFRGGFKESDEHQVKISDVSAECLTNFVRLLDTYCECILPNEVTTLLELVSVSDRFLVGRLTENILSYVMNNLLSYRSCQIIFKWAMECKLPLAENICADVIKYIFTANMTCRQMKRAVSNMLDGVYKECFLKDVTAMIKEALYHQCRTRCR